MKNCLKIFLIVALFAGTLIPINKASAGPSINNVQIDNIINGQADVTWHTDEAARSVIYFGKDSTNLTRVVSSSLYKNYHRLQLTVLEPNTTYYYKIVVFNREGEASETFVQNFPTGNMIDTIRPKFIDAEVVQVTGDSVSLYWTTNEPTIARIHYGYDSDLPKTVVGYGAYHEEHEMTVYHLTPNERFNLQIEAIDKHGNTRTSKTFLFNTHGTTITEATLNIRDLEPLSFDSELIKNNKVTIKFKTNLITRSRIYYGPAPSVYTGHEFINNDRRSTRHEVTLRDLEPNTTYYYIIDLYYGLYNRALRSQEYSFTTQANQESYVLGTKIVSDDIDTDGDGLSDNYEIKIGTNPLDSDTDGDGYPDGTEIRYGYDPNGPGKLPTKLIYNKPRISNTIEQMRAVELKRLLEARLGQLRLDREDWFTVVNAYIYGEYPVDAIAQSVRFGGKTVHPSIGWSAWKNTTDYQNYINR